LTGYEPYRTEVETSNSMDHAAKLIKQGPRRCGREGPAPKQIEASLAALAGTNTLGKRMSKKNTLTRI
jgi:hypothetical protein